MMALVRLILDPFDFVALVAVIRSPMVGIPDAALRPLWNAGLPGQSLKLGIEDNSDGLEPIVEAAAREVETLDLGHVSLEALAGWPEALSRPPSASAIPRTVSRSSAVSTVQRRSLWLSSHETEWSLNRSGFPWMYGVTCTRSYGSFARCHASSRAALEKTSTSRPRG